MELITAYAYISRGEDGRPRGKIVKMARRRGGLPLPDLFFEVERVQAFAQGDILMPVNFPTFVDESA